MKSYKLICILCGVVTISSCVKKTENKTGPGSPVVQLSPQGEGLPAQPAFKLVKTVNRDSNQIYRTTIFKYDNLHRLTSVEREETNNVLFSMEYEGDTMKTLTLYDDLGTPTSISYPLRVAGDGDSLGVIYETSGGRYYRQAFFRDGLLREIRLSKAITDSTSEFLHRFVYVYNDTGNLRLVNLFEADGTSSVIYQPLSYDNQKNILKDCSRLLFLFAGYAGLNVQQASSRNNFLTGDFGGPARQYEHSYNTSGYPVRTKITQYPTWTEYHYEN